MNLTIGNLSYQPQRIFCVGRNYRAHIQELKNDTPTIPVIFSKPPTSLVGPDTLQIPYPRHSQILHHEVEIVVMIGQKGIPHDTADALNYIAGLAVGLDLTLRDVQNDLIAQSLPWEKCKGFDRSAPIGRFAAYPGTFNLQSLRFSCSVNGQLRQSGNTERMIFPIPEILLEIAKYWELLPGDLIYTGTPEGIGALNRGDEISIEGDGLGSYRWKIV